MPGIHRSGAWNGIDNIRVERTAASASDQFDRDLRIGLRSAHRRWGIAQRSRREEIAARGLWFHDGDYMSQAGGVVWARGRARRTTKSGLPAVADGMCRLPDNGIDEVTIPKAPSIGGAGGESSAGADCKVCLPASRIEVAGESFPRCLECGGGR
jgi:hypothetical protein